MFHIETITKVGYRLVWLDEADAAGSPTPSPGMEPLPRRGGPTLLVPVPAAAKPAGAGGEISRRLLIGGTVLAAAGGTTGYLWRGGDTPGDSVAVLPFANLSNDPAQAYFSDGIAEELRSARAPGRLASALGLEDKQGLIRAYGARELASAVPTLSVDKQVGLAARIAGDVLDLGTLAGALCGDNPRRRNATIATAMVAGITMLDILAYNGVKAVHTRNRGARRDYSDRSGLPRGAAASRGLARRDFETPADYRAEGTVAHALQPVAA